MALRMRSRDRSTEDYGEPSVTPDQNTSYGFPGLRPGYEHMPSSIGPHSDITQAMATAAGWPGPGLGPMPPKGTGRPGAGMVPGAGWNPGVPHSGYPQSYNTSGYYSNPMGYNQTNYMDLPGSGFGIPLGGPGHPHAGVMGGDIAGGWGGGLWGGDNSEDAFNK